MKDFVILHSADKYNTHETYAFRKSAVNGFIAVENQNYSVVLVGMNKYLVKESYDDLVKIMN